MSTTVIDRIEVTTTDVVVIGAGAAGLSAALGLSPHRVTILTKGRLGSSGSSPLAQGGIAAALGTARSTHVLISIDTLSHNSRTYLRLDDRLGFITGRLRRRGPEIATRATSHLARLPNRDVINHGQADLLAIFHESRANIVMLLIRSLSFQKARTV